MRAGDDETYPFTPAGIDSCEAALCKYARLVDKVRRPAARLCQAHTCAALPGKAALLYRGVRTA